MKVLVYSHAVDNYISRVLGMERNQVKGGVEQFVEEQLTKLAENPDMVYDELDDKPPIHIRNGCAAPVVSSTGSDEKEVKVKTAYNSGTFLSKMDTCKKKAH